MLEALPPAYSNIITTAGELRRMLDDLSSPALKGMMDTASAVTVHETVRDYVEQLGDRLCHIHMIDADKGGGHLAWGEGTLPLQQYIRDLDEGGYAGSLSLEFTSSRYYLDPYPPLARSVEVLKETVRAG